MSYTREQIQWAIQHAGETFLGGDGVQPLDILSRVATEVIYLREVVAYYQSAEARIHATAIRPVQITLTPEQGQTLIGMPSDRATCKNCGHTAAQHSHIQDIDAPQEFLKCRKCAACYPDDAQGR